MRTAKVAATSNGAARGDNSRGKVSLKSAARQATALRLTATATERLAKAGRLAGDTRQAIVQMSAGDILKLVHELEAHRFELETQNHQVRQTQIQLEEARERYEDLYDFSPAAYLTLGEDAEILEASLSAGKLLGLERGRLIRQKFTRFVSVEAQDAFHLLRDRVFGTDTQHSVELDLVDAKSRRMVVHASALRSSASLPKQCRISLIDITRLKQSERSLRESEDRFRQVAETIDQVLWITVRDKKRVIYISPAYERIWGRPRQALCESPHKWPDALHPGDRSRLAAAEAAANQAAREYEVEYRIVRPDGSERWIHDSAFPVRDAKGTLQRTIGIAEDVTERRQAEQALRRSELNLSEFFNRSPVGLEWLSASGHILRANQAQLDLLGYRPEEYVGRFIGEFCTDPTGTRHLLEQLSANQVVSNLLLPRQRKDGAIRMVLVDAQPLWHEGEFLYSSIFSRDITDRLKLEREILEISERERRRIAEDLHDGLGQLLVGTAFLGSTLRQDLAAKSLPEVRQADRLLQVLEEAVEHTRSLARGLYPVQPLPNGLTTALKALASQTNSLFRIRCRLTCRKPVLIKDNTVATHLYRVAQEAVTNSIKHGKASRIEISLTRTAGRIALAVNDNGTGMPERPSGKPGMGLRIMHHRARSIGGFLTIEKAPGGGTTIRCTAHESPNGSTQPL